MGGSKARGAGFRPKVDPAVVYVAFNDGESFMVFVSVGGIFGRVEFSTPYTVCDSY